MEMGHPTPVRQPRLLQGHFAPSVGSQMLRSNWYTLFLGSHMLQLFHVVRLFGNLVHMVRFDKLTNPY